MKEFEDVVVADVLGLDVPPPYPTMFFAKLTVLLTV